MEVAFLRQTYIPPFLPSDNNKHAPILLLGQKSMERAKRMPTPLVLLLLLLRKW